MSITLDFLLLFFLFIIPGLVFKRIFFFKEFSKQFSIKDNAYTIIFFSFIPGLIFQIIGFFLYWIIHDSEFSLNQVLIYLRSYSNSADSEITFNISTFLIHQFNVNLLAFFSGFFISRLIRVFGLDIKSKFFRFSNQWYYIFSGEIESFEKFKKFNERITSNIKKRNEFKYYPPTVDVLIDNNDSKTLYTGFLVDYDLDPKNIHSLDKIYLKHAHRYRPKTDEDSPRIIKGSVAKVPIKGDVFVLNTENLVNINVTFIPTPKHVKDKKTKKKNTFYKLFYNFGLVLNLYVLLDILFFDMYILKHITPNDITQLILNQTWYVRIFISSTLNLCVSIFLPNLNEEKKVYSYHRWFEVGIAKIILIVIFSALTFWTCK